MVSQQLVLDFGLWSYVDRVAFFVTRSSVLGALLIGLRRGVPPKKLWCSSSIDPTPLQTTM